MTEFRSTTVLCPVHAITSAQMPYTLNLARDNLLYVEELEITSKVIAMRPHILEQISELELGFHSAYQVHDHGTRVLWLNYHYH